jgi:hypothetical protein
MPPKKQSGGFAEQIANFQINPNQWQEDVLNGRFLFDESNPYAQQMRDRLFNEYQQGLPNIDARFAQGGRFGSGGLAGAHALALNRFNTGVGNLFGGLWEGERGRMTDVLGQLSGENIGGRNVLGGVRQSEIGAAAQKASAAMAAAASRYGADRSFAAANMSNNRLAQNDAFGRLMSLYGVSQNQAQFPWQQLSNYGNSVLPILSGFGTQQGVNTDPGAGVSPIGMGLTGAASGMMMGMGAGGGKSGGGNPYGGMAQSGPAYSGPTTPGGGWWGLN